MVERLDYVRYILIGGSIVAALFNLVDELNKGAGLLQIFFYSGTLLLIAAFLLFIENDAIIYIIFYIAGLLMLSDSLRPGEISPAILLFGYANHLSKKAYLKLFIYLIVAILVTANHVLNKSSPEDLINTLMGYGIFFAFNELIYSKRQKNESGG